ncbi:16S rRNA (uracil1498-N3)-methyltransferase [Dethiosulfatibacter aminovorans DSM 17477]|uniref:Ribosomal RNA small subunit methyltransferase E n=1 Tax=Dethiosulfatibacter aminovorans DSM 17477 TaxID=1121476 RepID=A0A1M6DTX9_9FIRM|nr:RsmE family RNA methyltransferase [Dethiosulfatibacter aminovorans]SHI76717.1 16S rRNA (uracil1498-N3)-methyltransferase [Dethiosulfatibacter aminovorans DSM 17477]
MNRFFIDECDGKTALLKGGDFKHCKNVLRLRENDQVYLVIDEKEYIGRIESFGDDTVFCTVVEESKYKREADLKINLYQCLPKASKMELIVQKNTEVGVAAIIPVISHRTVVKLSDKKRELKKVDRWSKIAMEAAKQSMRNIVPVVDEIVSFKEMISMLKENGGDIIVPYEDEDNLGLNDIEIEGNIANVIIGPEGGFEALEIEELKNAGAKIVTLGPRILRTETAGIVVNSILMYKTKNI